MHHKFKLAAIIEVIVPTWEGLERLELPENANVSQIIPFCAKLSKTVAKQM